MNTLIKRGFRALHFAMGFHAVKSPKSETDILDLMQKLRPRNCGIDLIRVGSASDGGYLIPDDLEGIEYCFSPGVSVQSSFENELADRNIKSFLADYSVDAPSIMRPEFTFDRKFLGALDRDKWFTLATWKDEYLKGYNGDLMLQMDIEGSEYEVILSSPASLLNQFRIIVVEFHDLDRLFDPFVFKIIRSCFDKILESFHVVHIHPNNAAEVLRRGRIDVPRTMEFTFFNKRRVLRTTPQMVFPHRLDADNVPLPSLTLPRCWYDCGE